MHTLTESLLYEGSLKSFQDAVNLASIVSVTDRQGNIIYVNDLFCTISGYSPEELIGKNHRILNSGYHPKSFFTDLWKTISSGKPWRGEIKNRAKDGSYYWVDSVITPVFNDNNVIIQYLSVRNVITEQKENENFKNSIFSALMIGVAVIDKHGKVVSANKTWSEFTQTHSNTSFHADYGENYLVKCIEETEKGNYDASKALAGIQEVLDGSAPGFDMQFKTFIPSGIQFTSLRVTPFIGGGAVLSYYDITNEKVYLQEIVESKDKILSLSSKVAKLGYWELDTESGQLSFTEELLGIFENNNIEILDDWLTMIFPEDIEAVQQNIMDAISGNFAAISYRVLTRSKKLKWFQTVPSGLNTGRGRTMLYGTTQDITKLKNYELELERSLHELSERYEALMQFSYIVSHNLRSPIINLLELSSIISNPDLDPAIQQEITTHIAEACKKLDSVTKDLAEVLSARAAANKHQEPVSFTELIESVKSDLHQELMQINGKIQYSVQDHKIPFKTIKSYMESIFYNLLSNAIKYRSPERQLLVNIEIKNNKKDALEMIVSDNGIGIDLQKYGNKMFNLYQRFHKQADGKGLGLYMTKTQTEALGGKIAVQSEPNKGTTFILTFNTTRNEKQIHSH